MTTSWADLEPEIRTFLNDYDQRSSDPDGGSDGLFASTFLAVDPEQVAALTSGQLAAALPARRAMFRSAGVGEVRCQSARQLRLDDRHVLVAAEWAAQRDSGREPLTLSSTLLLRREAEGFRVLVYLNHRDIAALLGSA